MKVNGISYRTIWVMPEDSSVIQIIDQRHLPHQFIVENLTTLDETVVAIRDMHVRGAPLIGVTAAYGVYLALRGLRTSRRFEDDFKKAMKKLRAARPTAVNLEWAVDRQLSAISSVGSIDQKIKVAFETANQMAGEDILTCEKIGEFGFKLIEEISRRKKEAVNILTHCNAGWLACVDWGTATAPIYKAFKKKIPIHVWVSETRPRNQGASLTAWELLGEGVPHTVIADNTAGHLLQHGMVDLVIVGTDRTTSTGDVANKIGTYLKALAAKDNQIPFYVAAPSSSIDWSLTDGLNDIPIEERSQDEVKYISGWQDGKPKTVLLTPEKSSAKNVAFDVTPARLVSGIITERGICKANRDSILELFPEKKKTALREEGVIKFSCRWIKSTPMKPEMIHDLNVCRDQLYGLGLIGVYEDHVGYGNISSRLGQDGHFVITGSQTGGYATLTGEHYTEVIDFNLAENRLTCKGPIKASSESLTHAVLYDHSPEIRAVIHVHHQKLWRRLMNQVPTTAKNISYGTPEMAAEVKKLFYTSGLMQKKILVMAGHEDGIVAFGKDLTEAADLLIQYLQH